MCDEFSLNCFILSFLKKKSLLFVFSFSPFLPNHPSTPQHLAWFLLTTASYAFWMVLSVSHLLDKRRKGRKMKGRG
jgi:threonine/homoserine/homoserine lactone efflux protein